MLDAKLGTITFAFVFFPLYCNQPFFRFGDAVKTVKSHKFGSKADKTISPNVLQKHNRGR